MRFEELAYTVDGLPVTVGFHARLTVMSLPPGDERVAWIGRLLGVLEGVRPGDGASLVWVDQSGRRIRLERDEQGAATLTDVATGAELPYSAAHLSLDGRWDWFAAIGVAARRASDVMVVDADEFTGDGGYDRQEAEASLTRARRLLARIERRRQAAITRFGRRDELRRQIAALDEQVDGETTATSTAGPALPGGIPVEVESLAATCRAVADRRDELVARLEALREAGGGGDPEVPAASEDGEDGGQRLLRQLLDEVEPAFVDALMALADACRPFGVKLDAARIEAAGIGASGVAALTGEVLAEVAARAEVEAEPPAGDRHVVVAERAQLIEELHRLERRLPDEADLDKRHSAVERHVAALAASRRAGRWLVSAEEAETVLLRRADKARRVGRGREPLPLIVNDALSPFASGDKRALLDGLGRLGETTQIVYITDDPETLAWASGSVGAGAVTVWRPDGGIATVA